MQFNHSSATRFWQVILVYINTPVLLNNSNTIYCVNVINLLKKSVGYLSEKGGSQKKVTALERDLSRRTLLFFLFVCPLVLQNGIYDLDNTPTHNT